MVQATLQHYHTVLEVNENVTDIYEWKIKGEYADGMDIIGLVFASIVVGVAISSNRSRSQNLLKVFNELSFVMMKITRWIILTAPIGVYFLVLSKIMEMTKIVDVAAMLGLYFITVLCGTLLHGFVVLPIMFFFLTRKNPIRFTINMGHAMATGEL